MTRLEQRDRRIPISLLILRLGVFLVMLVWTLDKFVNPAHAAAVYANFYFLSGLDSSILYAIGTVQLLITLGFLVGFKKRLTYGLVLFLHSISTFSSFRQYLAPFQDGNLLFFAAWPMLAACFTLYYLKDLDTYGTLDKP